MELTNRNQIRFDLRETAPTGLNTVINRGVYVAGGFLGLFLLWGLLVPLSSAVIADGVIASEGQNKVLQHISGGRIKSIKASDGANLGRGETVMVLDPAVNQAELSQLRARQDTLLALEARLQTLAGVRFDLRTNGDVQYKPIVDDLPLRGSRDGIMFVSTRDKNQLENVFDAQRLELQFSAESEQAEYQALRYQVERLIKERRAKRLRSKSLSESLEVTRTELANLTSLVNRGYLPRKDLWNAKREEARLAAETEEAKAELQGLNDRVGEAENRVVAFIAGKRREVTKELTQVLGELAEIRDRISAAEQALAHTEIKAPVDGTLVNFSAHTVGGVVRGGAVLGEIVPDGADLVVEGRVLPKDIGSVEVGQSARAVITALNRRRYDPLSATISYVSADSIADPNSAQSYFRVRAKVANVPTTEDGQLLIRPGMNVVLYIDAGSRPFLAYLMQPLTDSFAKAFSER